MSILIANKDQQAQGAFDFGNILENKPVGFPHEGGAVRSFSNVFYWAHAWSDAGGLIDTHPHQGFEIMSYIIEGEISHYDSQYDRWLSLYGGDGQLIQAGNGISHAERFLPNTRIFQIWFDPNLNKTMQLDAAYTDVSAKDFPSTTTGNFIEKTIVGVGSALTVSAEKIGIKEYLIEAGEFQLPLDEGMIYSGYVINGEGNLEESTLQKDSFFQVKEASSLGITVTSQMKLFMIAAPNRVSYTTYAQMQRGQQ